MRVRFELGADGRATAIDLGRRVTEPAVRDAPPGLRLVVSYADAGQGHVGTIYQATGWLYPDTSDQSYLR